MWGCQRKSVDDDAANSSLPVGGLLSFANLFGVAVDLRKSFGGFKYGEAASHVECFLGP